MLHWLGGPEMINRKNTRHPRLKVVASMIHKFMLISFSSLHGLASRVLVLYQEGSQSRQLEHALEHKLSCDVWARCLLVRRRFSLRTVWGLEQHNMQMKQGASSQPERALVIYRFRKQEVDR